MSDVTRFVDNVAANQISRGTVIECGAAANVCVAIDADRGRSVECEFLRTSAVEPYKLVEGDAVLVWRESEGAPTGIILGRIESSPDSLTRVGTPRTDEVVIESKNNVTIKCGDASITLRADGKILIKGKELVSHAQNVNRVKGGAVAIN